LHKNIVGNPSNFGEVKLKEKLISLNDLSLCCWFAIDFLPNVRDIDLFLIHKECGVFSIEIKSIPLRLINSISLNYIEIRGRGKKENPNLQAYNALTSFRDYAKNTRNSNIPFTVATTCWPEISSDEWKMCFKDEPTISELADKMIMEDDLSTSALLSKKLASIYINPPIRGGSNRIYSWSAEHKQLIDSICIPVVTSPNIPEQSKFQILENSHRNAIKKKYPVGTVGKYRFSGVPGSGKTFALMQLAYAFGKEGYQVLFLCFNKVLASQIRGEFITLANKDSDPELNEFITVQDVFEHAVTQSYVHGIDDLVSENHLEWISLLLDEIKEKVTTKDEFPTILLVDETQDFQPEFISWIRFWSTYSTLIAVAEGKGQELYEAVRLGSDTAEWWTSFKVETLTQNYRNPGFLYKVAFLLANSKLAISQLHLAMNSLNQSINEKTLKLSRVKERGLELVPCSDELDNEQRVVFYSNLIKTIIEELRGRNKNLGELLIIVRGRSAKILVLSALQNLKNDGAELSFIDYTMPENRRLTPPSNTVRICTFESCRGLEAEECIVAGLECLTLGSSRDARLTLVALSRALQKTTVMINQVSGFKLLSLFRESFNVIDSNNEN
jgi:hypothetical protein